MKVVMQARPDLLVDRGGDTVQVLETRRALEALGVEVELITALDADLPECDLVHLFNLKGVESTYLQARKAGRAGRPIALSVIWWSLRGADEAAFDRQMEEILGRFRTGPLQRMKDRLKRVPALHPLMSAYTRTLASRGRKYMPREFYELRMSHSLAEMQSRVLEAAAILLPNSRAELETLAAEFPAACAKPFAVVPNGVGPGAGEGDAARFEARYGLRDFVLCVARIEARKNQWMLIRAAGELGLPLVCVGRPREPYHARCRRVAGQKVHFLGHLEGQDLHDAYAAARVHALPSWYETPGLSSLEAAAAGCHVVAGEIGATHEYFGAAAEYCYPADLDSIRDALRRAWNRGADRDFVLTARVRERFTWENAARETLRGYQSLLESPLHV